MNSPCDTSKCDIFFKDKKCKCYANPNTAWPQEDQLCAYLENGVLFECDGGCCAGGCPNKSCGEKSVKMKDPEERISATTDIGIVRNPMTVKNIFKFDAVFKILMVIVVFLIFLSTTSLVSPVLAVCVFILCIAIIFTRKNSLKAYLYNKSINVEQLWLLLNPSTLKSLLSRRN